MEITVYRDPPIGRESRALPAVQYNRARVLQTRSASGVAFVPIRSMQILAIIDAYEFVFVDSQYKQQAILAWQCFRPQVRDALDDPVPFEAEYYLPGASGLLQRLQPELYNAMQRLASGETGSGTARVLDFNRSSGEQVPESS